MTSDFEMEMYSAIYTSGVIAVLVIDCVEDAEPLARSLLEGGITAIELTLRTPNALEALYEIKNKVPAITAGAGTILTVGQVKHAVEAGAVFGVSPGMNPVVVKEARRLNLPFAPGIVTPSDIEQAVAIGCRLLKFFPAEASGGLSYLKNIAAPYEHLNLHYIPLGGIDVNNMSSYLKTISVPAVGGSWIAPRNLIQSKDWQKITQNAIKASEIVKQIRQGKSNE